MSDSIPLSWLFTALAAMLLVAGFFSIAETSMTALNRNRLKHLVREGRRSARLTQELLDRTDRLLGVILLGNNLVNAASAVLVAEMSIRLFGEGEYVLMIATATVTFFILVFSEITPRVIGATYPEAIALPSAYVLTPLLTQLGNLQDQMRRVGLVVDEYGEVPGLVRLQDILEPAGAPRAD